MNDDSYFTDCAASDDHSYVITEEDQVIVSAGLELVFRLLASDPPNREEREVIAKMGRVLATLPNVSGSMEAEFTLTGPRRYYDEHEIFHWWSLRIEEHAIAIGSGGHFYRESTGGDSFTSMEWDAYPGQPAQYRDYLSDLWMVDDATSFPIEISRIDLSEPDYSLDVMDEGESILGDDSEFDDADDDDEQDDEDLVAQDDATRVVESLTDESQGRNRGQTHANPPKECDQCHRDLSDQKFFVDGQLRGSLMWSNMCCSCFLRLGEGIGWGSGQLYAHQADGSWLLVGGFPPPKED